MKDDAKYIVWLDFGREGWQPYFFNEKHEAVEFILAGAGGAGDRHIKLTKVLPLVAVEE